MPGQVTITAAVASVAATAALTVTGTPVLVFVAVSPAARNLAAGASVQLIATGTRSDGSTANITGTAEWSSSAPTVTVGPTGLVTAGPVPGSTASVSAFIGTASGSASVTVIAPPVLTAIEVIPLGAGSQQFVAIGTYSDGSTGDITDGVTWASSNGQIAGVTGAGLATGVAASSRDQRHRRGDQRLRRPAGRAAGAGGDHDQPRPRGRHRRVGRPAHHDRRHVRRHHP